jgi:drug/metabolite transporter (DMT)-like permease
LFGLCIAIAIWSLFREKDKELVEGIHWPALIAIALSASVLAFNYAVKYIDVSVGSTVRSLSFLVTVVLAVVSSKEQLHAKDWVALVGATIALLGMG